MPGPRYVKVQDNDDSVNGVFSSDNDASVEILPSADKQLGINSRKDIIQTSLLTTSMISLYFVLSIALTFYNQWTFKTFKFPLLVTTYHLCIKFILSLIVRILYKLKTGKSRIILDWRTAVSKIGPVGFCSGIDIGFSSWGLELVTMSLYTMTKSTTIVFILIFAIILGLERKSWILLLIVAMISSGLCMFTYKATSFNTIGFSLTLFAAFMSGIRWTLAQLVMQKSKLGLHNPIDMIFFMQPFMLISILPLMLIFEGRKIEENSGIVLLLSSDELRSWILKISAGAFIAFIMELSEFLTLSYTSSLTLSVVGIFKEICQLVLAVEFNHDQLTLINILGLVLCLGGILCHIINKYWAYTIEQDERAQSVQFEPQRNKRSVNGNTDIQSNNIKAHHHISQKAPLLEDDALDFTDSDDQNEETSNVIYDIKHRRDIRR